MKVRNGFVSNSSSSSFIIAYKDDAKACPTCGHRNSEIDVIKKAIDASEESGWKDLTPMDLVREFQGYDEAEANKRQKEVDKYSAKGYKFAEITVDQNDSIIETVIGESKSVIQIGNNY